MRIIVAENMNNNNITQLVRSVVSSLQNLPATSSQTSGSSSNNNSNTNRNIDHVSLNEEVSQRFRLPRGQNNSSLSSARPLPRGGNGRFVPYTTAAKASKAKGKADIIIKDVCLFPSPRWKEVPRRQFKQELISRNLFIDAWPLDKSWSEQELRLELFNLFKGHLSGTTE